ncbi:MAG TPA: hypothetical protein VNA69_12290 [Thermoanaerobaculia bacterium]|nr:hypothetical protein [Thermoanaerobaculia bacterium]
MITIVFAAILLCAMAIALMNWRYGWLAAIVCGVLQDPMRKLTPGTPALMSMSIVAVYGVVLLGAVLTLQRNRKDFERRFPSVYSGVILVLIFLAFAAMHGVITFGVANWKVPALSLLIYCIPIPAVLLGYSWLTREEQLVRFFMFYSVLTSIAMTGTLLEYLGVKSPVLGLVGMPGGYIRHLPGIQIAILSGIYRAPDIMGWHAATLAIIGITMAVRNNALTRAWPWIAVAAWGFMNCIISGRRKAVYMVVAFAIVFFWRYFRRMTSTQIVSIAVACMALAFVTFRLSESERASAYTRGARTSGTEILLRLEGGAQGTIQQHGLLGAGLGAATQGVRHVTGSGRDIGWQEGGLGKLIVELGVPGLLAVIAFLFAAVRTMLRITAVGDIEGTSQVLRVALFGIVVANIANFLASAQAYSDPVLTLMSAFFLGCLFATATLDEKVRGESLAAGVQPATAPATA